MNKEWYMITNKIFAILANIVGLPLFAFMTWVYYLTYQPFFNQLRKVFLTKKKKNWKCIWTEKLATLNYDFVKATDAYKHRFMLNQLFY
jgi:hypothetical protein